MEAEPRFTSRLGLSAGAGAAAATLVAAHATTTDPRRAVRELLLLGASVASLGTVGLVLLAAHTARPPGSVLLEATAVGLTETRYPPDEY